MLLALVTASIGFLVGCILTVLVVARSTHLLVARLSPQERLEFARKVNRKAESRA